jgi:hypothetical protein
VVNQSAELPEGNVLLYPTIQRWFNCISTESRIFIHKQIVKTIRLKIENDETTNDILTVIIWSYLCTARRSVYTYMYNTINVNPAYAGSREALSVFALHRTQWVGLDGAQ